MSCRLGFLALSLGLLGLAGSFATPYAAEPARSDKPASDSREKDAFTKQVAPLLARYCTSCHGGTNPKAGLALDVYKDDARALKDPKVWEKVLHNVKSGEMPPAGRRQLSAADRNLIANWIDSQILVVDCTGKRDPGRVTLRRLNRAEYNNTVRDLLGVNFQPADDFPADDIGYGFDNIGDVLSLPPLLLEKYLAAAEKIVAEVFKSPELRKRILIADPNGPDRRAATRLILENFGKRAYRRPLRIEEFRRLTQLIAVAEQQGDGYEKGIQLVVQAMLVSPHFLFRIEMDPPADSPDGVRVLNDYEVAVRLSYFLWSSMPDEELFELAEKEVLRKNGHLEDQVRRMLKDPKARALVENFAGQWLQVRNLKALTPDPKLFPTFNESLRSAMLKETELFFEAIVKEDRGVLDFLDADFTFVNEPLARHYGIPDVKGNEFRRVKLAGEQRGGILTQASVLTVTSNPTRTSPVKRGKYILDNILGTPPPPPPPEAGDLDDSKEAALTGSLRQRMEQHRTKTACAICHQRMDPLGFGFENYDAIGAWRAKDGAFDIDPSGILPDGKTFKGPKELKSILLAQKELFARCLAEKMLTYALGRGLEHYDKCTVEDVTKALAKNDYKFSTLVTEIVKSDPFQKRKGKGGQK